MKKLLISILAFMVLSFSMIPCADGAAFADDKNCEAPLSNAQGSEADHEDACSPFCICSCCAGFSAVIKVFAAAGILPSYQRVHASFHPDSTYSISLPIWQPPQLV